MRPMPLTSLIENILIDIDPMQEPTCLLFMRDAGPDVSRFPHVCPRCGLPASVGLNDVYCSQGCG